MLEDVTNAFACTLAEVRKQVLEQCYQGTGFQMVEERVQNAVSQLRTDESQLPYLFATKRQLQVRNGGSLPIQLRVQAVSETMDAGGEASRARRA